MEHFPEKSLFLILPLKWASAAHRETLCPVAWELYLGLTDALVHRMDRTSVAARTSSPVEDEPSIHGKVKCAG